MPPSGAPFDHVWYWKEKMPGRKGQRCRVWARGAKNTIGVEFEDGTKCTTSRYAVRYVGPPDPEPVEDWRDQLPDPDPEPTHVQERLL